MMTAMQALRTTEKIQDAISYLVIRGILCDSERDKARVRLDKWAKKNGLKRKEPQS